jgi:hypothetical protein
MRKGRRRKRLAGKQSASDAGWIILDASEKVSAKCMDDYDCESEVGAAMARASIRVQRALRKIKE